MLGTLFPFLLLSLGGRKAEEIASTVRNWSSDCLFSKEQLKLTYSNVSAELKVEFVPLPSICNLTSYHIIIQRNTTALQEIPKDCHHHSFAIHSDRHVSGSDTSLLTAVFRYIYSGVYCVEVVPKEFSNSKKPYYQIAQYYTDILAPDISNWNTTLFVETNSREKSVRARFTNGPPAIDFERFRVHLRRVRNSCDEIENGSVQMDQETTPKKMDVLFTNLAAGNYCVIVQPLDERCHPDRVWGDTKSCRRYSVTYELAPPSVDSPVVIDCNTRQRDITIIITLLIAIVLFVSGVFYYLASRTNLLVFVWPPGTDAQRISKSDTEVTFDCLSKWDPSQLVPVLLLYARDSKEFIAEVDSLKRILANEGKCKVFDCFDEDSYQDIAIFGTSWITSRIVDESVRILLISSPCAVGIQENLIQGKQQVRRGDPHPFEFMFVQGLQEVMALIGRDGCAYNRVFLARFSNVPPLEPVLSFVSPFTLFSLPQHLSSLVKHLHGLSEMDETQPLILSPSEKGDV